MDDLSYSSDGDESVGAATGVVSLLHAESAQGQPAGTEDSEEFGSLNTVVSSDAAHAIGHTAAAVDIAVLGDGGITGSGDPQSPRNCSDPAVARVASAVDNNSGDDDGGSGGGSDDSDDDDNDDEDVGDTAAAVTTASSAAVTVADDCDRVDDGGGGDADDIAVRDDSGIIGSGDPQSPLNRSDPAVANVASAVDSDNGGGSGGGSDDDDDEDDDEDVGDTDEDGDGDANDVGGDGTGSYDDHGGKEEVEENSEDDDAEGGDDKASGVATLGGDDTTVSAEDSESVLSDEQVEDEPSVVSSGIESPPNVRADESRSELDADAAAISTPHSVGDRPSALSALDDDDDAVVGDDDQHTIFGAAAVGDNTPGASAVVDDSAPDSEADTTSGQNTPSGRVLQVQPGTNSTEHDDDDAEKEEGRINLPPPSDPNDGDTSVAESQAACARGDGLELMDNDDSLEIPAPPPPFEQRSPGDEASVHKATKNKDSDSANHVVGDLPPPPNDSDSSSDGDAPAAPEIMTDVGQRADDTTTAVPDEDSEWLVLHARTRRPTALGEGHGHDSADDLRDNGDPAVGECGNELLLSDSAQQNLEPGSLAASGDNPRGVAAGACKRKEEEKDDAEEEEEEEDEKEHLPQREALQQQRHKDDKDDEQQQQQQQQEQQLHDDAATMEVIAAFRNRAACRQSGCRFAVETDPVGAIDRLVLLARSLRESARHVVTGSFTTQPMRLPMSPAGDAAADYDDETTAEARATWRELIGVTATAPKSTRFAAVEGNNSSIASHNDSQQARLLDVDPLHVVSTNLAIGGGGGRSGAGASGGSDDGTNNDEVLVAHGIGLEVVSRHVGSGAIVATAASDPFWGTSNKSNSTNTNTRPAAHQHHRTPDRSSRPDHTDGLSEVTDESFFESAHGRASDNNWNLRHAFLHSFRRASLSPE